MKKTIITIAILLISIISFAQIPDSTSTTVVGNLELSGIIKSNQPVNTSPDYVITVDTTNKKMTNTEVAEVSTISIASFVDTLEQQTFNSLRVDTLRSKDYYVNGTILSDYIVNVLPSINFSAYADSLSKQTFDLIQTNKLKLADSSAIAISTDGDTLWTGPTVRAYVDANASLISGNDGEILLSDGIGGTKTSPSLGYNDTTLFFGNANYNISMAPKVVEESYYDINNGDSNTAINIGLVDNTTGSRNTAIGLSSAFHNTTGSDNISIGVNTSRDNSVGTRNVAIGNFALKNQLDTGDVAIGHYTGYNNNGKYNTFVGHNAGLGIRFGSYNTVVGAIAGAATLVDIDSCVLIGNMAGTQNEESSVLFIENTNVDKFNSLIWGDFANDSLRFNAHTRFKYEPYVRDTLLTDWVLEHSSGGDVYKVGNPVSGRMPVWTGDGTLGNYDYFTFDISNHTLRLANFSNQMFLSDDYIEQKVGVTTYMKLLPTAVDGSSVPYVFDTENTFSTTGSKLLTLSNAGNEKFSIDKDGAINTGNPKFYAACSDSTEVIAMTQNDTVQLTNGANGLLTQYRNRGGFTFQYDSLQIPSTAGWYVLKVAIAFSGANGDQFSGSFFIDDTHIDNRGHFMRTTSSSDIGDVSMMLNYEFTGGEWVKIMLVNNGSAGDITIRTVDWKVEYDE